VVDTLKGSPAVEAGLKTGDRILRINGKPTALMTLEQATEELKGEVGTDVNLQILRKNKEVFEVKLTRAQIEVPAVSYETKQESQLRVGYIKLDEFSSHAADEIKQAIKQLSDQQVSGFVLDLRENPGGLLLASVDIARLWMQQGEIVHTIDRRGGDRKFSANGTALTDLPLVILVNENSASASEILAGALKENKRATLVGTTTYGKGTVQSVHSLSDGSGLAVTIARYYLANGTNINKKGVQPDIEQNLSTEQALALENNPALIATKNDPQYLRAVSVLRNQSIGQTPTMPKPVGIRLQNQPKNSVPGQP
jgi:carboxyl-terminal processing protease